MKIVEKNIYQDFIVEYYKLPVYYSQGEYSFRLSRIFPNKKLRMRDIILNGLLQAREMFK
jgi:hypothetical protein